MTGQIIFTSFAGGSDHFRHSADRIRGEAISSGFFDKVFVFTDVNPSRRLAWFIKNNASHLANRGYAFWAWKPYLLLDVFDLCHDGDVIVYSDAGSQLSAYAYEKFMSNVEVCRQKGALFFYMPEYIEMDWTKKKLVEYTYNQKKREFLESPQIQATYFYIKVNKANRSLLEQWADIATKDDFIYINDTESQGVFGSNFVEHRHDQSILSLLAKKNKCHAEEYECHFRSIDYFVNSHVLLYPFHSLRNRSGTCKHALVFRCSEISWIQSKSKFIRLLNFTFFCVTFIKVASCYLFRKTKLLLSGKL